MGNDNTVYVSMYCTILKKTPQRLRDRNNVFKKQVQKPDA